MQKAFLCVETLKDVRVNVETSLNLNMNFGMQAPLDRHTDRYRQQGLACYIVTVDAC